MANSQPGLSNIPASVFMIWDRTAESYVSSGLRKSRVPKIWSTRDRAISAIKAQAPSILSREESYRSHMWRYSVVELSVRYHGVDDLHRYEKREAI